MIDEKKLIAAIEAYAKDKTAKGCWYDRLWGLRMAIEIINQQPKVGEWIPVSEGVPDENIGVQATIEMPHGKLCVFEIWLQNGRWIVPPRCRKGKVVAWQPQPEPWEGE